MENEEAAMGLDVAAKPVKSNGRGSSPKRRDRIVYFDLLNIFACLCVIYLHVNGMVHSFSPGGNWILALVIELLGYVAVPIFFMLTGATLMRYRDRYSTREFAIKRIKRTVVPFLFWSVFWYFVMIVIRAAQPFSVVDMISRIAGCGVLQIYWFFYALFAVYLSLPALSLLADNRRILWYLVIGSFVLESLLPQVFSMLHLGWDYDLKVAVASGYILLVILGYLLSTEDLDKRQRMAIYIVGIAAFAFKFAYTLDASEANMTYDKTLSGYTAFAAVAQTVAVFVWFKYRDWTFFKKHAHVVAQIAACTFGVYLIHMPFLEVVVFGWMGIPMESISLRLFGALIFFVVMTLLVWVMRKVPLVREIMP